MLTGKQLRVRFTRDRIVPRYLNVADPKWLQAAEALRELFRTMEGRTRGELEDEIESSFGNDPDQLVHQGLAKLLEDRCEFEVVSGHPPEQLREAVFLAAATARAKPGATDSPVADHPFDRNAVLREAALKLETTPEVVDGGLFADLKSEQRLIRIKDLSGERLLRRYNVALAQAVLLRSTKVTIHIRREPPQRYRQLLRQAKFHRLVCDIDKEDPESYVLRLDGPLSLFSATQKYGLQLALFFPAVLPCCDFDLEADLLWGPQRKPKKFSLSAADGLESDRPDTGQYLPPELAMFAELFRKKIADWEIAEETEIFSLGDGFWVPDYRLLHRETGKTVLLEVLGFWRKGGADKHLERLRHFANRPFVLAVSEQLRVDEAGLEDLPAGVHRFLRMPLPEEIARLAGEALSLSA